MAVSIMALDAECCVLTVINAECHYAECRYAECRGSKKRGL